MLISDKLKEIVNAMNPDDQELLFSQVACPRGKMLRFLNGGDLNLSEAAMLCAELNLELTLITSKP